MEEDPKQGEDNGRRWHEEPFSIFGELDVVSDVEHEKEAFGEAAKKGEDIDTFPEEEAFRCLGQPQFDLGECGQGYHEEVYLENTVYPVADASSLDGINEKERLHHNEYVEDAQSHEIHSGVLPPV